MGCTVTASILSQKDWVDSSKFLENNSSKDKIHTILPPSLHPKKKGHHLTTMKLWNIDAGPRTFSSKRQLATGRIPHSGGSLVWVPPPIRCGRQWRSVSFRYVTWRDEVLLTGPLCFQTGLYKCFWNILRDSFIRGVWEQRCFTLPDFFLLSKSTSTECYEIAWRLAPSPKS